MWWLYCGRQILANNKDMVAREGLEPPPPAFSGGCALGGIGGSIHAAFELLPQQSGNPLRFCWTFMQRCDPEFWTPKPPAPMRVAAKKSGKNKPTQ